MQPFARAFRFTKGLVDRFREHRAGQLAPVFETVRDCLSDTVDADGFLDSRNVLDVLQRAGRQGGYHAFRRFRFAVLRKAGVPDGLIKLWPGHSQNLIDLYAAQLRYDDTYRRGWCERAGLGFELGELGYKLHVPIRPALVA
jgi:hypothetical protein